MSEIDLNFFAVYYQILFRSDHNKMLKNNWKNNQVHCCYGWGRTFATRIRPIVLAICNVFVCLDKFVTKISTPL